MFLGYTLHLKYLYVDKFPLTGDSEVLLHFLIVNKLDAV
jgi:hypothetical protein